MYALFEKDPYTEINPTLVPVFHIRIYIHVCAYMEYMVIMCETIVPLSTNGLMASHLSRFFCC